MIVEAKIKSRDLGEETGRHSYMIHEHSISIQVFEIDNFEFKTKLRMLQNSPPPLTRISSPRLRSYLRFEEMRVFLPQCGLLLPLGFALGVITP
jgi:hypothetical protein